MTTRITRLMIETAAVLFTTGAAVADTIVIGHFGDPTPMNAARAEGKFEEATGWDIEFCKFAAGTDVIAARSSSDVVLSGLSSTPLAIATSQGVDLQLFILCYAIGESESPIVRDGSGIEALEDLKGKRVALPVSSTAHFSLMGSLNHAGIAESEVVIMNMPPDQIAAAWEQDAIDAAFIWQLVKSKIMETGSRLAGADKTAERGYPTFNAWVVNPDFAVENEKELIAFARVMDEPNHAYTTDRAAWTPASVPGRGQDPTRCLGS